MAATTCTLQGTENTTPSFHEIHWSTEVFAADDTIGWLVWMTTVAPNDPGGSSIDDALSVNVTLCWPGMVPNPGVTMPHCTVTSSPRDANTVLDDGSTLNDSGPGPALNSAKLDAAQTYIHTLTPYPKATYANHSQTHLT